MWAWIFLNFLYGALLLAYGIAFLVITFMKNSADFADEWESLGTYGKSYFDNDVGKLWSTHKENMVVLCAFSIVEAVLYLIQGFFFFILRIFLYKGWKANVRYRFPQKTKSGVDRLERQPFKQTFRKRKTIKKVVKSKDGKKEEIIEEEVEVGAGGMEALREEDEMDVFEGPRDPNRPAAAGPGPRGRFDESD